MIDRFWQIVSRSNAFLFSLAALLVLMLVLVWALRPFGSGEIRLEGDVSTGDVQYDDEMGYGGKHLLPDEKKNPFQSAYIDQVNDQLAWAKSAEKAARQSDKQLGQDPDSSDKATDGNKVITGAKSRHPPRAMHLIYRGIISNLDGTKMALFEDVDSGTSKYYRSGAGIAWGSLVEFTRDSAGIAANGMTNAIPRGVAVKIVEEVRP